MTYSIHWFDEAQTTFQYLKLGVLSIPLDPANRHYQEVLDDIILEGHTLLLSRSYKMPYSIQDGVIVLGTLSIPFSEGNSDYQAVLDAIILEGAACFDGDIPADLQAAADAKLASGAYNANKP